MEITFLGTSCSMPTKDRSHPAVFLFHEGEGILLDCGEGTQRQFKIAGIKPTKIKKILISHWHGDHVFGLPGLLQTLVSNDYNETLHIYGPEGTKKHLDSLKNSFEFESMPKLEVHEVESGTIFKNELITISAEKMKHSVPCIGYAIKENDRRKVDMKKAKKLGLGSGIELGKLVDGKAIEFEGKKISPDEVTEIKIGKKVAYVTDTRPCDGALKLAKDSDILICETTYKSDLKNKAEEFLHMTTKEAAIIANQANVKKLYMFHYSTRYKKTLELVEDARQYFDNVFEADDFTEIKL